ncbi:MAG: GNAT family N-acetyltransferase [Microlunatus sp.]|nr:GNAT family N-acetyltransferase [Microlunatus sp.]
MTQTRTERLDLAIPTLDDLDQLHSIQSDPRVWTHFPRLRPTRRDQTRVLLDAWIARWQRDGLGSWIVRLRDSSEIIGSGGCTLRGAVLWNLGYRFHADQQGNGYATEVATAAIAAAHQLRADVPIVAYLVEHNAASARVAQKIGLELVDRVPDADDRSYTRLIFADRPLGPEALHAART